MLSKDSFLNYKPKTSEIEIPELGGTIIVREISANTFMRWLENEKKGLVESSSIVAAALVDENFNPIMSEEEVVAAFDVLPTAIVDKIVYEVFKRNGLNENPTTNNV